MYSEQVDVPNHYEIIVLGWPNLEIEHYTNQSTIERNYLKKQRITKLNAELLDQTALYGLLDNFRDRNIVLLQLEFKSSFAN